MGISLVLRIYATQKKEKPGLRNEDYLMIVASVRRIFKGKLTLDSKIGDIGILSGITSYQHSRRSRWWIWGDVQGTNQEEEGHHVS